MFRCASCALCSTSIREVHSPHPLSFCTHLRPVRYEVTITNQGSRRIELMSALKRVLSPASSRASNSSSRQTELQIAHKIDGFSAWPCVPDFDLALDSE